MVGGSLADAIVFDCNNTARYLASAPTAHAALLHRCRYIEELPEDLIHERYSSRPRVTWSYYFGSTHPAFMVTMAAHWLHTGCTFWH